jgi:hypothetical protein
MRFAGDRDVVRQIVVVGVAIVAETAVDALRQELPRESRASQR